MESQGADGKHMCVRQKGANVRLRLTDNEAMSFSQPRLSGEKAEILPGLGKGVGHHHSAAQSLLSADVGTNHWLHLSLGNPLCPSSTPIIVHHVSTITKKCFHHSVANGKSVWWLVSKIGLTESKIAQEMGLWVCLWERLS